MTEQVQEITQEQAATATATLAERQSNTDWMGKVISKTEGWPEKREFQALMEASSKDTAKGGDRLDKIIAGTADTPLGETTTAGQINTLQAMDSAAGLREIGLSDPQIKQCLSGAQASKAEYDHVKIWRSDRLGDPEWTARYLKGGAAEVRQMALANIVISNGYVGQDAQPPNSTTMTIRRMA